jgi:hypothetical protein
MDTPPVASPGTIDLFKKYAFLLADSLETTVEAAGKMILESPDRLRILMAHLASEVAVVKAHVDSGALAAVTVAREAQSATNMVGSIVEELDPALTPQVTAVEATVAVVEKTTEVVAAELQAAAAATAAGTSTVENSAQGAVSAAAT